VTRARLFYFSAIPSVPTVANSWLVLPDMFDSVPIFPVTAFTRRTERL